MPWFVLGIIWNPVWLLFNQVFFINVYWGLRDVSGKDILRMRELHIYCQYDLFMED